MKSTINKIITVEGLDKTGKSTFVNAFNDNYKIFIDDGSNLKTFSFPNKNTPIGNTIRNELAKDNPNTDVISSSNFLSEMTHFWMNEIYNLNFKNPNKNKTNYIFDRYFISTLAYQGFYKNNTDDIEFIKYILSNNWVLKLPTDIIMFDLPNEIIIERTINDKNNNLVDAHDTTDESIINKRRDAYKKAADVLDMYGITIHWIDDVSVYETHELVSKLIKGIFY